MTGSLENVRSPRKLRGDSCVSATGAKSMSIPARLSAAAVARPSVATCAALVAPSARADAAGSAHGKRLIAPPSWSTAVRNEVPSSHAAAFNCLLTEASCGDDDQYRPLKITPPMSPFRTWARNDGFGGVASALITTE